MSVPPKMKSRLGRGLSSLISVSELPVEMEASPPAVVPAVVAEGAVPAGSSGAGAAAGARTTVAAPVVEIIDAPNPAKGAFTMANAIRLSAIVPNPNQPRKHFSEAGLQSLAASLKSTGMVQPIIVRPMKERAADGGMQYQLIAGERRWRAARLAELQTVPALLRDVDAFMQAQMALIENIQREDLNAVDRAIAYRMLMEQLGLTQAELSGRLGEDRSSIANFLRVLDLVPGVQEMVRDGLLNLGHAKILATVTDPFQQQDLAKRVVEQGLSVRNLERIVEAPVAPPKPAAGREISPHLRDLERTITSNLGMKVKIQASGKKGKGKLVIQYGSLDQFDQILERLGVKVEE